MTAADVEPTEAELTRIQTLLGRLTMSEAQRDRETYTAARRSAQEDRRSWSDLYFGAIVRESLQPLRGLAYRVMQLSDRPSKQVLEDLREAARRADAALDYGVRCAEAQPLYGDRVNAEVVRLRAYIVAAGQELHGQHGDHEPGPDRCPGAELIRGMDDVPEERDG